MTPSRIPEKLKLALARIRSSSLDIDRCLGDLQSCGSVALFGGANRDVLRGATPRDYDLVVDTDDKSLQRIMESFQGIERNRFGGYRAHLSGTKFDVWTLASTWAFRQGLISCSIENLQYSVFLNVDAIVADLSTDLLYDELFRQAEKDSRLDIILEKNPFPGLCVLRTLVTMHKGQFSLSRKLHAYVSSWTANSTDPLEELLAIQHRHYGTSILDVPTLRAYIRAYGSQNRCSHERANRASLLYVRPELINTE